MAVFVPAYDIYICRPHLSVQKGLIVIFACRVARLRRKDHGLRPLERNSTKIVVRVIALLHTPPIPEIHQGKNTCRLHI